ncbi:MAG: hypothetical protein PHN79_08135 [Methanoregula sp.]|nr:hypothetical protein [Methanoregula sp.]
MGHGGSPRMPAPLHTNCPGVQSGQGNSSALVPKSVEGTHPIARMK